MYWHYSARLVWFWDCLSREDSVKFWVYGIPSGIMEIHTVFKLGFTNGVDALPIELSDDI